MYQLTRTDTFDEQLREIILRIADNFGTANALEILDSIEESLNNLSAFPRMGADPKYPVLKRQGYKVLILEKDLVFYKIDDDRKTVTVYAVFDQRQDYLSIIRGL